MMDLEVVEEPATATAMLDPMRARVLATLAEPGSATTVARSLGESRQKVNYHLRALEEHGLILLVEEVPRRGLTERVMVASAREYVVSPDILGTSDRSMPNRDPLSSRYLLAIAARLVREVAALIAGAARAGKPLATLTIDADIRFASAAERAAFTHDLGDAVNSLVARYHAEEAPGGRWHRLVVAAHPRPGGSTGSRKKG